MPHRTLHRVVSVVTAATAALCWAVLSTPRAEADADGCAAGMSTDFNGDGRSDTVVGDPYATTNGQTQAGRVVVLYGDADGRVGEGARGVLTQGQDAVGGVAEAGDRFGAALAVADVDCDEFADLVVGTPLEDINGQSNSGYVQVIWGSAAGLGQGDASVQYTQTNFGLPITAGDQFGFAVDALEDVGQGGTPEPDAYALAIGAPGGNIDGINDAGYLAFRVATDGGSVGGVVSQNTPGVDGGAETGDRFGAAVSLNYLAGESGTVDAVVGVPNEDVGTATDAGAITVIRDLYDGAPAGGTGYDQNSPGIPGGAEAGDRFGATVDTVRAGATTRMAVGAPGEGIGSAAGAGAVQLFSSNALTVTPGASLSQDTAGVTGVSEAGDGFGSALALIRPGLGDTATRLAVGAPGEDGAVTDSGTVQVFPVTDLDAESSYDQGTPGFPGDVEAGDRFGATLAAVAGATERILIIGIPDDQTHPNGMVNVLPLNGSAPRYWAPGVSGVPASGASRFGGALTSSGI